MAMVAVGVLLQRDNTMNIRVRGIHAYIVLPVVVYP